MAQHHFAATTAKWRFPSPHDILNRGFRPAPVASQEVIVTCSQIGGLPVAPWTRGLKCKPIEAGSHLTDWSTSAPQYREGERNGRTRRKCRNLEVRANTEAGKQSEQDLAGKTVVIVGLGKSGRAAAQLALARGAASVIGLDSKTSVKPLEHDEALRGVEEGRVRTELGSHRAATLQGASLLVLSPGVPAEQPDIAAARQAGVPALSELAFAAEALPRSIPIAAVSGTNGKSTVTSFTGQLLQAAGVRTFVGGNLGTPLSEAALHCLAFPRDDPPYQAAVVEVSSYQMELPGAFTPKAAAILNLTPDHLERHRSMEAYGACKCGLFRHMAPSDLAIIPHGDPLLRRLAAEAGGQGTRAWLGALPGVQLDSQARRAIAVVPTTGAEARLLLSGLRAVGRHNAGNAATAALLALALGVGLTQERLQEAIPLLQPLPHRMQVVGEDTRSLLWVNDSKATNVDATLVGLEGLVGRKVVLLLGGIAKAGTTGGGLGFERLVEPLAHNRAVIAFGASGEAIERELREAGVSVPCGCTKTMAQAVDLARQYAHPGDVVLLSPACASFDEFQNFEHRGKVFAEIAIC